MSSTTNGDKSSTTTTNATTNTTPSSGADQHINDKPQTTYTIADLGLRPNPLTQQTIIGPTRSIYSLRPIEWTYLILSLATLGVMLGLTAERLIALSSNDLDFVFAFLLSWTTIFCFVYVIQGIFRERAFELLAFVATMVLVWIYVIVNFAAKDDNRTAVKIVRLVVACVFCPFIIMGGLYFSSKYFKSKQLIFRTVGANRAMQRCCEILFAAESLLKFDAQLAGSAVILWLRKGFHLWNNTEKVVVCMGSVVTISWVILGMIAIRLENRIMMYIFFASSLFEPSIIIWNLVRYSLGPDDTVLEVSTFLSGIIAIIIRGLTVVAMVLVMNNFGKGLKQKVYGAKEEIIPEETTCSQPIVE